MPYSNGLNRNIVQCLKDFAIPLYLSHTIVDIQGDFHVERVVIAQVDEHRNILPKTQKSFAVDTLLLSIGLLPEMSLADHLDMEMDSKSKGAKVNAHYETSVPHIYACGNALHVHDIVDFVSMEGSMKRLYVPFKISKGSITDRNNFLRKLVQVFPMYCRILLMPSLHKTSPFVFVPLDLINR